MQSYQTGMALLGANRSRDATSYFERAVKLSPSVAEFHHFLGVALQRNGRGREAASCFRSAIAINPGAALSYVELAHLMLSIGDPETAVGCLDKVVELDPTSAKARFMLARALAETQRLEEADTSLDKAIELDSSLVQAYVLKGRFLQQRGRFEEAEVALRHAISLKPDSADGYYALINSKRITESDRSLIGHVESLVDNGRQGPDEQRHLRYALGKAYDDLGEYESAMSQFREANRLSQARLVALGRVFDAAKLRQKVDETVNGFTREYLESLGSLGSASEKPIFIVGMARSGTTLLEQMVSSHPGIEAAGELGSWHEIELFRPPAIPDSEQVAGVAERFLGRLDRVSPSAARVTVKTPQNYMVLGQILALFPNCRILHCRRDPIDTCLSIYKTCFFAGPDFAHDLSSLVAAYREYLRVTDHWRSILPASRYMEVSYEQLIRDREPVLKNVTKFLGLEWHEALLHHEGNDHPISTPSLWQARQPVFTGSIERWRRYEPWLGPLRELEC